MLITNLESISHIANSSPVPVNMSEYNHFMTSCQQTLGQLEDVLLHSPDIWVKEIRHHAEKGNTLKFCLAALTF